MAERRAGISTAITHVADPASNSRAREALDAGRAGPLPHADQHAAVADDEHVAALELGRPAEAVATRPRCGASANSGWWR